MKIGAASSAGKRIIAVGTTVVRALESAAQADGIVRAGHRYSGLLITPDYLLRVTDGILTGLHEPTASHLELFKRFYLSDVLERSIHWGRPVAVFLARVRGFEPDYLN